MTISDAQFERIKQHQPRIAHSNVIDAAQEYRLGRAYLALTLLSHLHLHYSWGISYPTVEALAMAQGEPINPDAGPTERVLRIHELLTEAMFTPEGYADFRVLAMLRTYGFPVHRNISQYEDDCYHVTSLRGYFVVYPPEVK
jgi:hypothetical protein